VVGGEEFHKNVLDNLYDGVYFTDLHRTITYWNKGAERISGFPSVEVLGKHCSDNLLVHVDDSGCSLCLTECPLTRTLADGCLRECEVFLRHKAGHRVPVLTRVAPIRGPEGEIIGAVEIFSDNTEMKVTQERLAGLRRLALSDPLTGLGNRRYVEIALTSRLDELRRYGWGFGVLFIDVDHFKQVNDHYGHEAGDSVLGVVSRTLAGNLRASDVIGRWGGEEFVVLLLHVDASSLQQTASRLRALVEQSSTVLGRTRLQVTISVGGTLAKEEDTTASILERADQLMYRSKSEGRNRTTVDCG
jgi:diguanylate cyclase (GGDEF)-like protein/PAS domain S-box-containing protein